MSAAGSTGSSTPAPSTTGTTTTGTGSTTRDALETLAGALDSAAYAMTMQGGRRCRLTITNRRAAVLTESVYVENGWFWWGWGERLAPVEDVEQAAEKITAVLRDNCSM